MAPNQTFIQFQNLRIEGKEEVDQKLQQISQTNNRLTFIVFKIKEGVKDSLFLAQHGESGWESFEPLFKDD